jgi:hypothetical protein
MNKLLILPCTSEKLSGGIYLDQINDYFNNDNVLIKARELRSKFYLNLLSSNLKKDINYFIKRRTLDNSLIQRVNNIYFNTCFNGEPQYMEAINRYDGILYNNIIKKLIHERTKRGLHVLIISGLYGVLKYNDHIVDYQLDIKKGGSKIWKINQLNSVSNSVLTYLKNNQISNSDVTVFLSDSYSEPLKDIVSIFKENLWDKADGYGHNHLPFLIDYLSN